LVGLTALNEVWAISQVVDGGNVVINTPTSTPIKQLDGTRSDLATTSSSVTVDNTAHTFTLSATGSNELTWDDVRIIGSAQVSFSGTLTVNGITTAPPAPPGGGGTQPSIPATGASGIPLLVTAALLLIAAGALLRRRANYTTTPPNVTAANCAKTAPQSQLHNNTSRNQLIGLFCRNICRG
jgi:LPXTG-motif cell wall-anchored protein